MRIQPAVNFSGPVGAHRIQNEVDRLARRRLLIQQLEQFAELARAMFEADHAAHLSVIDAEAGQQVDRAVAHVLEFAACWPASGRRSAWNRRLVGRRGCTDAEAGLLIDAEPGAIRGWLG